MRRRLLHSVGWIFCAVLFSGVVPAEQNQPWAEFVQNVYQWRVTCRTDLSKLDDEGVKIFPDYHRQPTGYGLRGRTGKGLLESIQLIMPEFKRGVYYSCDAHPAVVWPDGANRVQPWPFTSVQQLCSEDYYDRPTNYERVREGMFLLLELKDGRYLAVVPICGPDTLSWLYASKDDEILLNVGTFGWDDVSCDVPLYAWSYSDDVYTACRRAWELAITCSPVKGQTDFRMNKEYPEIFKYLGWCSWEEYRCEISEDVLIDAAEEIESSGLPVRYMLIDDGHFTHKGKKLVSFEPDKDKFPNGWEPIVNLRKEDKIKWIGIWYNMQGYWKSIARDNQLGERINRHLMPVDWHDGLVPKNRAVSAELFYNEMLGTVKDYGFDFVKIDNQSRNICFYLGTENAVEATCHNLQALESAADKYFDGMINCMAHSLPCVFNSRDSSVMRCSIDYKQGREDRAKSHLLQSYSNILWLGQTLWGDHDMFHSSDPAAGKIMAVSKAISGGPVYLSDNPEDFVDERIGPLCYEDGRLLRPIAPAAPLPESVFAAPMKEKKPFKVIAPLSDGAAAVVVYNLRHPAPEEPIEAVVTAEDYRQASGMIQPYPGRWEIPEEGLFLYDWHEGKGRKLEGGYSFKLKGFSDRLLLLCPVRYGWAVVGRLDKYLAPAATELVWVEREKITFRLAETGSFGIWLSEGRPRAQGVTFEKLGPGLWKGKMKMGIKDKLITIHRSGFPEN